MNNNLKRLNYFFYCPPQINGWMDGWITMTENGTIIAKTTPKSSRTISGHCSKISNNIPFGEFG